MKARGLAAPLILICAGVLFLVNNLGFYVPIGSLIRNFWPFLLIGIGILHLSRSAGGFGNRPGNLMGGVVLITIGVLFALQQLAGISFGATWPVLLIAIGVAGVLQFSGGSPGASGRWHRGGFRR